jgi:hypothetical protein
MSQPIKEWTSGSSQPNGEALADRPYNPTASQAVRARYRRVWNKMNWILHQVALAAAIALVVLCIAIYAYGRGQNNYIPTNTSLSDLPYWDLWLSAPVGAIGVLWYIAATCIRTMNQRKADNHDIPVRLSTAVSSVLFGGAGTCLIVSAVYLSRKKREASYEYPFEYMDALMMTFLGIVKLVPPLPTLLVYTLGTGPNSVRKGYIRLHASSGYLRGSV